MTTIAENTGIAYERMVVGQVLPGEHRWVGRCKKCGATHKVEGELKAAWAPEQKFPGAYSARAAHTDYVVKTTDGRLFTVNGNMNVPVRCGDHWCTLKRVIEGTKKSKHECGARCTNATGPNCDCRCKGKNHGINC